MRLNAELSDVYLLCKEMIIVDEGSERDQLWEDSPVFWCKRKPEQGRQSKWESPVKVDSS